MIQFALAYFLGTLPLHILPILPGPFSITFLSILGLLLLICAYRSRSRLACFLSVLIVSFLMSIHFAHKAIPINERAVSRPIKILVTGVIRNIPKQTFQYQQFEFNVQTIKFTNAPHVNLRDQTLLVSWYQNTVAVHAGQCWQLALKIKPPRNFKNPGSQDWRLSLFSRRIKASATVQSRGHNILLSDSHPFAQINTIRERLSKHILNSLHKRSRGLIAALVVGDRTHIPNADWRLFQTTGTSHLMAISGLHVGMIATVIFFVIKKLFARFLFLPLVWVPQKMGALAAIFFAFLYSVMAGLNVSTQRAFLMITLMMLSVITGKFITPSYAFVMALACVCLFDPLSSFSLSFVLSFYAVGMIFLALSVTSIKQKPWQSKLRLQTCVSTGLMPVTLWYFKSVSLLSVLANVIAIPLTAGLIVPVSLLGVLFSFSSLGHPLLNFAASLTEVLLVWLSFVAHFTSFIIHYALTSLSLLCCLFLSLLLGMMPKGVPNRYLGLLCLFPLLAHPTMMPAMGKVWVDVLDVGQGLSVLIRTSGHSLLFDTGPGLNPYANAGTRVIIPFLEQAHIHKLDMMVVSHRDLDHRGGANSVLSRFKVKSLYTSAEPELFHFEAPQACRSSQHWKWDGVDFEFLHPDGKLTELSTNNRSCVLKMRFGTQSILLTGDIENSVEAMLVHRYGEKLLSSVLIAPHHGSKTSSSMLFIKQIDPKYVIFSTGFLNRFHFPHNRIVERYRSLGSDLKNTAVIGGIRLEFSAEGVNIKKRPESSRIWL